jgi:hypothetical protein
VVPRVFSFFVGLGMLFSFPFCFFLLPIELDEDTGVAGKDREEGNGENELLETML